MEKNIRMCPEIGDPNAGALSVSVKVKRDHEMEIFVGTLNFGGCKHFFSRDQSFSQLKHAEPLRAITCGFAIVVVHGAVVSVVTVLAPFQA